MGISDVIVGGSLKIGKRPVNSIEPDHGLPTLYRQD